MQIMIAEFDESVSRIGTNLSMPVVSRVQTATIAFDGVVS